MESQTIVSIILSLLNGIFAYKMYKQGSYKTAMLNCVAFGSCMPLIF